jgi:hypothetical protein
MSSSGPSSIAEFMVKLSTHADNCNSFSDFLDLVKATYDQSWPGTMKKPIKVLNSYHMFVLEIIPKIKETIPPNQRMSHVNSLWKNMSDSEKQVYKDKATIEKKEVEAIAEAESKKLMKVVENLRILTNYHFWTLDNPNHDFADYEDSDESKQADQQFADLVGTDPSEGMDDFLETSTGLEEVTIFSPYDDYCQPCSAQLHRDNKADNLLKDEDLTYRDVLDMIAVLPHPDGKNDWVDTILVDNLGRIVVTLTN